MSRGLCLTLFVVAGGCLASPSGGAGPGAGDGGPGSDGGGTGSERCKLFADAAPRGEVAGTFTDLDGVLAADLDGDGDRDLMLTGDTPLGTRILVARMPQADGPLRYHWSSPAGPPVAVAAADLVGSDGCAELVVAEVGGATTPLTIYGQEVTGDQLFRELSQRTLEVDSSAGMWLVADRKLGAGEPAVALATPTTLHSLPPDGLLAGDAIPTITAPDFTAVRGISLIPRAERSELLVAEDGRVRWMEPVLPGGQLQFAPLRVLSVGLDPMRSAGGADLDRDGERDDFLCAGDSAIGLVLDDSVDPPVVTELPAGLSAGCPPFAAAAAGRLESGDAADLVVVDACSSALSISVLVDAGVGAGPSLEGAAQLSAEITGFTAVALAVVDADGDGQEELWLFDGTGDSACRAIDGSDLVACS